MSSPRTYTHSVLHVLWCLAAPPRPRISLCLALDRTWRLSWVRGDCCYCTMVSQATLSIDLCDCSVLPSPRVMAGRVLTRQPSLHRVEWAYCFDVHLNAFVPLALAIFGVQMVLWPCMYLQPASPQNTYIGTLLPSLQYSQPRISSVCCLPIPCGWQPLLTISM